MAYFKTGVSLNTQQADCLPLLTVQEHVRQPSGDVNVWPESKRAPSSSQPGGSNKENQSNLLGKDTWQDQYLSCTDLQQCAGVSTFSFNGKHKKRPQAAESYHFSKNACGG